jgi:predicted nucleic acid-binding protein
MIVLDTNVVSELSQLHPERTVAKWLERQDIQQLFLCIPVIAELAFGAQRVLIRDRSTRYQNALDVLVKSQFRNRILPNDMTSALRYGLLVARREAAGRPIGPMDAMIAAICLVHDATLATRNVRDFDGLDLKLINPFEAGA